jgi:transcriptional regulator of arginine metabolism
MHEDGFLFSMTKLLRQQAILELARERPIGSQEELQHILAKRGLDVGQATLSRDIRELALIKTVHGYTLPNGNGQHAEASLPPAHRLVREFVQSVRPAQNLIVLKTAIGSARLPVTMPFLSFLLTIAPQKGWQTESEECLPDARETQNSCAWRNRLCRTRTDVLAGAPSALVRPSVAEPRERKQQPHESR